jgi:type VI secretion system protein ImpF
MKIRSDLDPNLGLMPSILDRLIDPESQGTAWRQGYGIDQMVEAVQRDLEELLNTRQSHAGLPEEYVEVLNSIVGYGLPDLTSLNALTPQQREEIGRVLESAVAKYEPRLRGIRATMLDPGDTKQRTVRFRIDARLCIDPAPEVSFETVMELTTGRHSVQQPDA